MYFTSTMINAFLDVASTKSFSKTADRLFVSQQAVSKQISQLEKALGTELFDRRNHMALTRSGEMFYHFFRNASNQLKSMLEGIDNIQAGEAITYRIGVPPSLELTDIIGQISESCKSMNTEARVEVVCLPIPNLEQQLMDENIDFMISMFLPKDTTLFAEELLSIRMKLYTAKKTDEDQPVITIKDLNNDTLLLFLDLETDTEEEALKMFSSVNNFNLFSPKSIRILSSEREAFLAAELGEGVIQSHSRNIYYNEARLISIDLGTEKPLYLIWKSEDQNDLAKRILDRIS